MIIQGKFKSYEDDLSDAFEIRKKVFQDEQNVNSEIDYDEWDKYAMHVVIYVSDKAVATGRLVFDGDTYRIGRVAVLKEERGKQYGDFVVRMLVDRAFQSGAKEIILGSQLHVIGFYEKLGFKSFGEEYEEAGIKHMKMRLTQGNMCSKCKK